MVWMKGKIIQVKSQARRKRELGYSPLNSYFEGSHFHHLHLEGDHAIGIFIPEIIHKNFPHQPSNQKSMEKINEIAFNYLDLEQYEKHFGKIDGE